MLPSLDLQLVTTSEETYQSNLKGQAVKDPRFTSEGGDYMSSRNVGRIVPMRTT